MSLLPIPVDDPNGLSARQLVRAQRAQAGTKLELFRYSLQAHARAEIDRMDSQAIADASRAAFDEEADLLDHCLSRANGSAAKAALAARHVERLAAINDRRITQRFGG